MITLNPVGMVPSGVITTISTCFDSNTLNNGGNYWPDILSGDAGVLQEAKHMKRKHLAFGT